MEVMVLMVMMTVRCNVPRKDGAFFQKSRGGRPKLRKRRNSTKDKSARYDRISLKMIQ
jgi:hypothetical protein